MEFQDVSLCCFPSHQEGLAISAFPVATELSWAIIMGDYQQSPCHCSQDRLCCLCTGFLSSPAPNWREVLEARGVLWLCGDREYLKSPISARNCTAGPSLAKTSSTETFPAAFPALTPGRRLVGPGRTLPWLSCCGKGAGLHQQRHSCLKHSSSPAIWIKQS